MSSDWHITGLTVGQVAERMQIAPSAVRWYADQGLLPHERVAGNQRRFFADVLCRVAMIRAAQKVGLSLSEIHEALEALPPGQPPTRQDWERLATHLRTTLTRRIDDLFTLLNEMTVQHPDPTPIPTAGGPRTVA
ncbi:MerR family transcriptional regulator, redox-sensitive transcriptional activator SoxR [Nonomuraea maritima]|uniref:MerR family transcriptional regulator, redox-sensitive transcriptional activator SoxR n=1 Tax=Nonomuraea maritima TaxID=683260 RepID=A0A1G9QSN1_9ACTN|nr:MerR family transcriptional regulator [Nonomuraea maritima]SDM13850.1 MerR family transcriptional regulator, redox-sensitive transcriptional activator SoxR [Nonomuraea maritima]